MAAVLSETLLAPGRKKQAWLKMESVMELLLAVLLTVLSAWFWWRRALTLDSGTQHSAVQAAPVQSPAAPPAGCSVVLSADHDSCVTAPTVSSNYFYAPSVFNFTKNTDIDLPKADTSEKDSGKHVLPWKHEENKVVLTKGIAGIGKTVSVQKFILDWVEGGANQDIHCIFFLPFREMNVVKPGEYSLHQLLVEFQPEMEKLRETKFYEDYKLAFIFDGLDESRFLMDFDGIIVSSVKTKATVDVLITNLIRGNLLPSFVRYATSGSPPAEPAVHQVPSPV
ncbi:hypothetical protein NFI96_003932, partial [Prochilodus magdalenae]